MNITDLNGNVIEVTDLNAAIKMAGKYCGYRHEDKQFAELDKKLNSYWTDVHRKLLQLQSNSKKTTNEQYKECKRIK